MEFEKQLDTYLRARFTLIMVVTREEERALAAVRANCEKTSRQCLTWDYADYFKWLTTSAATPPTAKDPLTALDQIDKFDPQANIVFVLKDFHETWNNAQVKRKLRNLAQSFKYNKKTIVVTTPSTKLPDELRNEAVVLNYPLPNQPELQEVLDNLTRNPAVKVNLTALGREKLVKAALGLTAAQAQRVFASAIVGNADSTLDDRDIDLVTLEKRQILLESEALEFYPVSETPDDVGGLDILKNWLRMRDLAFTQKARDYGLPAPKGIALIGIPGTGKSLTAKMIGGLWRMPLIRLDVGALFGSLVGESEERTRRALHLAETIAPCVLWIDEMEKALAHGGLDSGTSTRVFGSILTWMQEKTAECFVVATANDISSLPPELLRRGRFDEIFFLDLPSERERKEIFSVHLRKRRRISQDYDLDLLARRSEGYVGSEIEQAVIDAMYGGFSDGGREFSTEDILYALSRQVPLSVSQRETIEALRAWLREGRAQSASAVLQTQSSANAAPQIQLDLNAG
jgi:ATP-dependent 26S proteasome regulatory subunit